MESFGRYISAEISASYRYIGVSADTGKVRFGRALIMNILTLGQKAKKTQNYEQFHVERVVLYLNTE